MFCFFGSSPPALPEIRPYPLDPSLKSRSGNASLPDPSRCVKMCQVPSWDVRNMEKNTRYHKIRNKWQRMAKAWRVDGRTRAEVTRLQVALRGQQLPTMHWRSMKPMNTNFSDAAPNVDCRHLLCYKLVSAKAKSIESSCDPDWEHKGRWYRKIMEDLWCSL